MFNFSSSRQYFTYDSMRDIHSWEFSRQKSKICETIWKSKIHNICFAKFDQLKLFDFLIFGQQVMQFTEIEFSTFSIRCSNLSVQAEWSDWGEVHFSIIAVHRERIIRYYKKALLNRTSIYNCLIWKRCSYFMRVFQDEYL